MLPTLLDWRSRVIEVVVLAMRGSRGGSLRVALLLAAIACVSSLYEDQVMLALLAWRSFSAVTGM